MSSTFKHLISRQAKENKNGALKKKGRRIERKKELNKQSNNSTYLIPIALTTYVLQETNALLLCSGCFNLKLVSWCSECSLLSTEKKGSMGSLTFVFHFTTNHSPVIMNHQTKPTKLVTCWTSIHHRLRKKHKYLNTSWVILSKEYRHKSQNGY